MNVINISNRIVSLGDFSRYPIWHRETDVSVYSLRVHANYTCVCSSRVAVVVRTIESVRFLRWFYFDLIPLSTSREHQRRRIQIESIVRLVGFKPRRDESRWYRRMTVHGARATRHYNFRFGRRPDAGRNASDFDFGRIVKIPSVRSETLATDRVFGARKSSERLLAEDGTGEAAGWTVVGFRECLSFCDTVRLGVMEFFSPGSYRPRAYAICWLFPSGSCAADDRGNAL